MALLFRRVLFGFFRWYQETQRHERPGALESALNNGENQWTDSRDCTCLAYLLPKAPDPAPHRSSVEHACGPRLTQSWTVYHDAGTDFLSLHGRICVYYVSCT